MNESFQTEDGPALTYARRGSGPLLVCGHFTFVEKPEPWREEITSFLA
ncbi:MAG: hypothetical protein ACYDA3_11155 [Gaiellaceae bacterium]